ncbi:SGNH/GDSL hydrolase family protein [Dyella flagellata]|uniref:DUF1579 domain-containing protein n=1 Tax=Dyella flagellata TaxID=1867833 RepID=A0ABQ5XGZ3_9GAMM|nr:hypothetical protein [Dyella flagellata]GLQ90227.1 hypothetical protein GCM10007898_38020 [Dyella flagellata]
MALVNKFRAGCLLGSLIFAAGSVMVWAQSTSRAAAATAAEHDGQHDFNFEFGTWKTHVSLLRHPLTGSKDWAEFDGITVVHKVWNGQANLLELDMHNASSHAHLASFRLYNPATRQWGLYFVNSRVGTIGVPTVGGFTNGRGEFSDKETLDGKPILVRFVITPRSADAIHFEQAFSADNGKTWETNWIADDTRVKDRPSG